MEDVIIVGILILIIGGAILYIIREKKNGAKCIGCPSAKQCGAKCSGNSGGGCNCHATTKEEK